MKVRVKILIGNSLCTVSRTTRLPLNANLAFRDHMTVSWESRQSFRLGNTNKYRSVAVTNNTSFYDPAKRSFPTGLLLKALEFFDDPPAMVEETFSVKLVDRRTALEKEIVEPTADMLHFPDGGVLRPYQLRIISECLEGGRGTIHAATSSGKTPIAAGLIKCYQFPKTVFLVNKQQLVTQQRLELQERLQVPVGIVSASHKQYDWDSNIVVAMVQTLAAMAKLRVVKKKILAGEDIEEVKSAKALMPPVVSKWFNDVRLVLGDEIHNASKKSGEWVKLIQLFSGAPYRFGLTGTPKDSSRPDRELNLIAVTGPIIGRVRNKDLAEEGYTAKLHIMYRACRKFPGSVGADKSKGGRYAAYQHWSVQYNERIAENDHRNKLVVEAASEFLQRGIKTMVLCSRRKQAELLMRSLKGYKPILVMGATGAAAEKRRKDVDKFRSGKTKLLIATTVVDEGFNVPDIGAVVLAGGGKSEKALLQRLGRTIRQKKDGANVAFLVDFSDMDGGLMLKHYRRRRRILLDERAFIFEKIDCPWSVIDRVRSNAMAKNKNKNKKTNKPSPIKTGRIPRGNR